MIAESFTEQHPNQPAEIIEAFIPDNIADEHLRGRAKSTKHVKSRQYLARWDGVEGQRSRGRAIGTSTEAARQGHAGLAFARFRGSLRSTQCRDAAKPHAAPARAVGGVRRRVFAQDPPRKRRLLRQDEGVLRGAELGLPLPAAARSPISAGRRPRARRSSAGSRNAGSSAE